MKRLFLFCLLAFFALPILAQTSVPEDYSNAVRDLKQRKYALVIPVFERYSEGEIYGDLANYSKFHLAEAQLGLLRYNDAISNLEALSSKNWAKSEETNYALALAYFGNNLNVEALRKLSQLSGSAMKKLAADATFENLKDETPGFFVTNLQEFQSNPGYTAAMRVVFENSTILSSDQRAAYYELLGNNSLSVGDDSVLEIAVLLPFTNGGGPMPTKGFVYELYQGIELAVSGLQARNVAVNLTTFDTQRDLNELQKILNDESLAKADIILGPIYRDETEVVSAFAESQSIPFVHPLSNLTDRFADKEFSYIFRPSVEALADGIVSSMKTANWGDSVAIGYGGSTRDVNLAKSLDQKLRSEGFKIVGNQEVNSRNVREYMQSLGIRSTLDSMEVETNQLILLTDNPNISQPAFFLMESVTSSVPVLVMDSWLGFNFTNFEILEYPNFYIIGNNALNFNQPEMDSFREAFYEKYSMYPSLNAALGLEMVYWVSENLSPENGFDLRKNLDRNSFQPGRLSWGFNFQNSNHNRYVPVFKIEKGELKPIN